MNHKVKLTPEIQQKICASIRAGGFPHVAAMAWGVPEHTFEAWMKQGCKTTKAKALYRDFYLAVEQAKAQARLKAEMKAMEEDPKFWLKNGPGKEQPDSPGWTTMMRPLLTGPQQTLNIFASPDFLTFLQTLRAVLAPYPQALAALTLALERDEKPVAPLVVSPPPPEPLGPSFEPSLN